MKITGGNYRDETRIVHMLQALERLELESAGVATVDELSSNDQLSRAIMYDFIVLGEAANNVTDSYCASHPEVPWQDVSGFRHKLVHDYSGIDFGILFDALKTDVPKLLSMVRGLVAELPPEPSSPPNLTDFE